MEDADNMKRGLKAVQFLLAFLMLVSLLSIMFSLFIPRFLHEALGIPDLWAGASFIVSMNLLILLYATGEVKEPNMRTSVSLKYPYLLVSVASSSVLSVLLIWVPHVALFLGFASFLISFLALIICTKLLEEVKGLSGRDWSLTTATFFTTAILWASALLLGVIERLLILPPMLGLVLLARQVVLKPEKKAYRIALIGGLLVGFLLFSIVFFR